MVSCLVSNLRKNEQGPEVYQRILQSLKVGMTFGPEVFQKTVIPDSRLRVLKVAEARLLEERWQV